MKKHWSEVLACNLCGKRFRSVGAEMRHRHNARFVCTAYPADKKDDSK